MKLVYSASNTVGSWLIRAGLSAPGMPCRHSHVEILIESPIYSPILDRILPTGTLIGACGIAGKVIATSTEERLTKASRIMVLHYPDIDSRDAAKVVITQLEKWYDYKGASGLAINRDWQEDDKWLCSELAAWVALQCGVPLLRADHVWRITPPMLALSPLGRDAA